MTRPTKTTVDCSTGVTVVEEFTDEEIAAWEAQAAEEAKILAKREAELQAKAELKTSALAKLTALGLTEDEAVALLG